MAFTISHADSKKKNVRRRSELRKSGKLLSPAAVCQSQRWQLHSRSPALAPPGESHSFGTRGASSIARSWKDGLYIVSSWEGDEDRLLRAHQCDLPAEEL